MNSKTANNGKNDRFYVGLVCVVTLYNTQRNQAKGGARRDRRGHPPLVTPLVFRGHNVKTVVAWCGRYPQVLSPMKPTPPKITWSEAMDLRNAKEFSQDDDVRVDTQHQCRQLLLLTIGYGSIRN